MALISLRYRQEIHATALVAKFAARFPKECSNHWKLLSHGLLPGQSKG